jgi:poly(3-hydroxybutyrate) depolymerase
LQHTGFVAMNPKRHATSHYDYFKDLIKGDDDATEAHRKFYDEYNAVLDMDADYYLETIKTVFQEYKLVKGTWDVISVKGKTERVTPGDIKTTAVMTVEGELDDISGAGQTQAALAMCSGVPASKKKHLEAKGAGHYGIFSGRRWREVVYPSVKAFILEQNKMPALEKPAAAPSAAPVKPAAEAVAKEAVQPQVKAPAAPVAETPVKVSVSMAAAKTAGKPTAQAAVPYPARANGKPTTKVPRRK